MSEMRLYDHDGKRLYFKEEERTAFLSAAALEPPTPRVFTETLRYTGYRLFEALELTPERIDLSEGRIVLRSLKRRREDMCGAVPVPKAYIEQLDLAFTLRQMHNRQKTKSPRLWPWGRPVLGRSPRRSWKMPTY